MYIIQPFPAIVNLYLSKILRKIKWLFGKKEVDFFTEWAYTIRTIRATKERATPNISLTKLEQQPGTFWLQWYRSSIHSRCLMVLRHLVLCYNIAHVLSVTAGVDELVPLTHWNNWQKFERPLSNTKSLNLQPRPQVTSWNHWGN